MYDVVVYVLSFDIKKRRRKKNIPNLKVGTNPLAIYTKAFLQEKCTN